MASKEYAAFKNYFAEVEAIQGAFEEFYDEMDDAEMDEEFYGAQDEESELTESQEAEEQEAEWAWEQEQEQEQQQEPVSQETYVTVVQKPELETAW